MPFSFAVEKKVAVAAVLRACSLTSSVFKNLVQGETITKDDKSPVTIADYSAQAVINVILSQAFPNDPIIGEESSQDLLADTPEQTQLRARIKELANEALRTSISGNDKVEWGIGPDAPEQTEEELLKAIDRGSYAGGPKGRMWTLDPIDGTKGFLRGGQYAVCLALVIDADVKLAVMGCPNLAVDPEDPEGERGVMFVAVKGQGTEQRSLSHPRESSLLHLNPLPQSPGGTSHTANSFRSMSFDPVPALNTEPPTDVLQILESVEAGHSSHSLVARISRKLGITKPSVRMDSQAKYGSLARGDGSVYLRMPVGKGEYQEKIWDHAPGALILEEAGAMVTDTRGERLNFGLGRTLGKNFGIVAAPEDVHKAVLKAVQECKAEEARDDEEADRAMRAEAAEEKSKA